jgi:multiple sugar transport system substrate-binding protein
MIQRKDGNMFFKSLHATLKRFWLISVVICMLIMLLYGCDAIGFGPEPTPEPVTITFAYNITDMDIAQVLIQKFNQQSPNITVSLLPMTYDELLNIEAGEADVRALPQEIIPDVQERGDILSLDSFIEQDESFDRSDFYPGMLEAFTLGGETWAIPAGADPVVMYYNRGLFDRHSIPYPQIGWTRDDFLSAALTITDPAANVFGYVSMAGSRDARLFVYQYGGQVYNDVQHPTRPTFNAPLNVEALEWYAKLYHEYDIVPTPEVIGEGEEAIGRAILQSQVGMWAGPFYQQGGRSWPVKWTMINWGMVTFPRSTMAIDGDTYAVGFGISSQTQYPDEAWQFVSFLGQNAWKDLMPARRSVAESAEYEQEVGEEIATVARKIMENGSPYSPELFTNFDERVRQVFAEAVPRIISGEWMPQEAMDWAQQEAEATLGP